MTPPLIKKHFFAEADVLFGANQTVLKPIKKRKGIDPLNF